LYTALGDISFLLQSYEETVDYMYDAINCPDGFGNPFIYLRLGESLFETGGDVNRIKDYLMKAYMLAGTEIFEGEDEKYFEVIKDIVN
jgi:hypothetical protein